MNATCATCGGTFDAKTHRAKYCSGACKKRAAGMRSRTGQVVQIASARVKPPTQSVKSDDPDAVGPLVGSLRDSFKDADLQTPAGRIAMRLCADVDALTPGVPGYAGIVAQMRAAVDDLRSQAKPKVATPLTMLRERRAADRSAASG